MHVHIHRYTSVGHSAADGFVVQTGDPEGPADGFIDPSTEKTRTIPLEIMANGEKAPFYGATLEVSFSIAILIPRGHHFHIKMYSSSRTKDKIIYACKIRETEDKHKNLSKIGFQSRLAAVYSSSFISYVHIIDNKFDICFFSASTHLDLVPSSPVLLW